MAGASKYEDDDWGLPKRKPLRPLGHRLNTHFKRYRVPVIIAAAICGTVYWLSGFSLHTYESPDWRRFAYVSYATDSHSMCNSYMVFEALHRLDSKADRVLMYPEDWQAQKDDPNDRNSQLLIRARDLYGVKLKPTQLLGFDGPAEPGTLEAPSRYDTSMTKLRVFEMEEYDRILYFDNDVILQQHMDELFLSPKTPAAMPRQYWLNRPFDQWPLSSALMLIQPDATETKHMWDRLQQWRLEPDRGVSKDYDDRLLNDRFRSSAMVLPHRPYLLQTSVFRSEDSERRAYMGTTNAPEGHQKWNSFDAVKEAKLIHFNDDPLPKPWVMWPLDGLEEIQPDCDGGQTGTCSEREVWKGLYDDFRVRRKELCGILIVPEPDDWLDWKNKTGYIDR